MFNNIYFAILLRVKINSVLLMNDHNKKKSVVNVFVNTTNVNILATK